MLQRIKVNGTFKCRANNATPIQVLHQLYKFSTVNRLHGTGSQGHLKVKWPQSSPFPVSLHEVKATWSWEDRAWQQPLKSLPLRRAQRSLGCSWILNTIVQRGVVCPSLWLTPFLYQEDSYRPRGDMAECSTISLTGSTQVYKENAFFFFFKSKYKF